MSGDWFRRAIWNWGVPILSGSLILLMLSAPPVRGFTYSILEQLVHSVTGAPKVGDPPGLEFYSGITVKYRVTATVRVNGEIRSASSLQVAKVNKTITLGANYLKGSRTRYGGESVLVPIIGRQYLMVAMRGPDSTGQYESLMRAPCPEIGAGAANIEDFLTSLSAFRGGCDIPPDKLPLLLKIGDIADIDSVTKLELSALSEEFGASVEFVSLHFQVVDEPVVFHLKENISWLSDLSKGKYLTYGLDITKDDTPGNIYLFDILQGGNFLK